MLINHKCIFCPQIYTLEATRRQIPRHVQLEDSSFATQVEDPISLSIVYQPITIKDSQPKHTFSAPILDELTRTSKSDPINETSLGKDWRFIDYQLDNKLSNSTGFITLSNGGISLYIKKKKIKTKDIFNFHKNSKMSVC